MMSTPNDDHNEALGIWAFNELLGVNPSMPYPFKGASVGPTRDSGGQWRLKVPKPKRRRTSKSFTNRETNARIVALGKLLGRAQNQLEQILTLGTGKNMASMLSSDLCTFMSFATAQLARAAEHGDGSHFAVNNLVGAAMRTNNELCELARRRKDLVKPVAKKCPCWPVNYFPRNDERKALRREVDALGVGTESLENIRGEWRNSPSENQRYREVVGRFATRLGQVLIQIHKDENLRRVITRNSEGWSDWVLKVINLPPLTKKSASKWFGAGWPLFLEANEGTVSTHPALRPVGESRAKEWEHSTKKQRDSQRDSAIKEAVKKAFRTRFGSAQ